MKKPREREGHSPRWAAEPEKIIIIIIICNMDISVLAVDMPSTNTHHRKWNILM
jgi:hypothetical protein